MVLAADSTVPPGVWVGSSRLRRTKAPHASLSCEPTQGSTLSFLSGCPKSLILGWYRNFLVYWYLKLDNQVVKSTCPKDQSGWIWRADDPYACGTLQRQPASFFTHWNHVFLGFAGFLVPGIAKCVTGWISNRMWHAVHIQTTRVADFERLP